MCLPEVIDHSKMSRNRAPKKGICLAVLTLHWPRETPGGRSSRCVFIGLMKFDVLMHVFIQCFGVGDDGGDSDVAPRRQMIVVDIVASQGSPPPPLAGISTVTCLV